MLSDFTKLIKQQLLRLYDQISILFFQLFAQLRERWINIFTRLCGLMKSGCDILYYQSQRFILASLLLPPLLGLLAMSWVFSSQAISTVLSLWGYITSYFHHASYSWSEALWPEHRLWPAAHALGYKALRGLQGGPTVMTVAHGYVLTVCAAWLTWRVYICARSRPLNILHRLVNHLLIHFTGLILMADLFFSLLCSPAEGQVWLGGGVAILGAVSSVLSRRAMPFFEWLTWGGVAMICQATGVCIANLLGVSPLRIWTMLHCCNMLSFVVSQGVDYFLHNEGDSVFYLFPSEDDSLDIESDATFIAQDSDQVSSHTTADSWQIYYDFFMSRKWQKTVEGNIYTPERPITSAMWVVKGHHAADILSELRQDDSVEASVRARVLAQFFSGFRRSMHSVSGNQP